jgi:internalin A
MLHLTHKAGVKEKRRRQKLMKKHILFIMFVIIFIFALTACNIGNKTLPNQLYETFQSGDFTANNWVRGGDLLPLMQSQFVQKGKYAAGFPNLSDGERSFMYIDLDIEEDMVISFYVKTNLAESGGALTFTVDGADAGIWFQGNDWKRVIREIPAGEHRLKWEVSLYSDPGSNEMMAFLDNIMISKFIPLGEPIVFNDDAFKNYVRRIIGKRDDTISGRYTLDQVYANEVKDIELVVIYEEVTDITGLEHFTNLQQVDAFAEGLTDISPMANLQNIEEVDFSEMPISDISPLDTSAKSGCLKTLEFEAIPLSQASLNLIKTWDQIENLTLRFISLGTLDFLPSGNSLIKLTANFAGLTNIDSLANQTNLTHLTLRCNQINDLSPLSNLTLMKELDLQDNQITDLGPLENLSNMERLTIGFNEITDLSPLLNMSELTDLRLYNNQVADLSPLAELINLERLDAEHNQITDITVLENLLALTLVDVSNNPIENLLPLEGLPELTRVEIGNTNVTDLSPLITLGKLEYLSASHLGIANITPIQAMSHLKVLDLQSNDITDITPIVQGPINTLETVNVQNNFLDLTVDSEDMNNIQTLIDAGILVHYQPQK